MVSGRVPSAVKSALSNVSTDGRCPLARALLALEGRVNCNNGRKSMTAIQQSTIRRRGPRPRRPLAPGVAGRAARKLRGGHHPPGPEGGDGGGAGEEGAAAVQEPPGAAGGAVCCRSHFHAYLPSNASIFQQLLSYLELQCAARARAAGGWVARPRARYLPMVDAGQHKSMSRGCGDGLSVRRGLLATNTPARDCVRSDGSIGGCQWADMRGERLEIVLRGWRRGKPG